MAIFKMILCLDSAMGLGSGTGMNWNVPSDMKMFKEYTTGSTVVMGRSTYESIGGKGLPNRTNIVLSRDPDYSPAIYPAEILHSVKEVLEYDKYSDETIWIIGGREIYLAFLEFVDEVYITILKKSYDCKVKLPEVSRIFAAPEWKQDHFRLTEEWTHFVFKRQPNVNYDNPSPLMIAESNYDIQERLNKLHVSSITSTVLLSSGLTSRTFDPTYFNCELDALLAGMTLIAMKQPGDLDDFFTFLTMVYFNSYLKARANFEAKDSDPGRTPYKMVPVGNIKYWLQECYHELCKLNLSREIDITEITSTVIPPGETLRSLTRGLET